MLTRVLAVYPKRNELQASVPEVAPKPIDCQRQRRPGAATLSKRTEFKNVNRENIQIHIKKQYSECPT